MNDKLHFTLIFIASALSSLTVPVGITLVLLKLLGAIAVSWPSIIIPVAGLMIFSILLAIGTMISFLWNSKF